MAITNPKVGDVVTNPDPGSIQFLPRPEPMNDRLISLMTALSGITTEFISKSVAPENATDAKLSTMSTFDLVEAAKAQSAIIERLLLAMTNYRYQAAANDPYFNPDLRRLAAEVLDIEQNTLLRIDEVIAKRTTK